MNKTHYIKRMRALYETMDALYDEVSKSYDISCQGCAENCCTQRFFHHTFAEELYLQHGLQHMPADLVQQIMQRAEQVIAAYDEEVRQGAITPIMCPANVEGLCAIYPYRPMICRMHGMPLTLTRPDGETATAGGCTPFDRLFPNPSARIDRTTPYTTLAQIEADLRREGKLTGKYQLTTTLMLIRIREKLQK